MASRFLARGLLAAVILFNVLTTQVNGVGLRGKLLKISRSLVPGNPGSSCTTPWGCQWGMAGTTTPTYIFPYWVTNANVFWRCENPKQIALTFDDGPNQGTEFVLQELRKHDVTATFFINAKNLVGELGDTYGKFLTTAESEGHVIAHHTFSHANITAHIEAIGGDKKIITEQGTLNPATKKFFQDEFALAESVANDYLPLKGMRRYLRPPYVEMTDKMATVMQQALNMSVVQLSLDTKDFSDLENIHKRFAENVDYYEAAHSYIVLQHDIMYLGDYVREIERIINTGKARGYTFVGVDECLNYPTEIDTRPATPNPSVSPTKSPSLPPHEFVAQRCQGEPCQPGARCRSKYGSCGNSEEHCNEESTWSEECAEEEVIKAGCRGDPCNDWECRNPEGVCGVGPKFCTPEATWRYACRTGAGSRAQWSLGSLGVAVLAMWFTTK